MINFMLETVTVVFFIILVLFAINMAIDGVLISAIKHKLYRTVYVIQAKSCDTLSYIKTGLDSDYYLKEDYTFSKLGEGLAPLIFQSYEKASSYTDLLNIRSYSRIVEIERKELEHIINVKRAMEDNHDEINKCN